MDFKSLHVSHGGSFPYFLDKLLHLVGWAFGHNLDRAVTQVADIPRQSMATSNPMDKHPKSNSLHHAVNNDAPCQLDHGKTQD